MTHYEAIGANGLKPCAFCGGKAEITQAVRHHDVQFRVECGKRFTSCPMNARTHHHGEQVDAEAAWNTRAANTLNGHEALLAALKKIAAFQDDICQMASAEMLYMLLDVKVGIARDAIASTEKVTG